MFTKPDAARGRHCDATEAEGEAEAEAEATGDRHRRATGVGEKHKTCRIGKFDAGA